MSAKLTKKQQIKKTPFVIITVFIVIMVAGILTNEPKRVLEQAISVCLSCIGIG